MSSDRWKIYMMCSSGIYSRYVFALYGFLALTCFNAMRSIQSIAIVAMVNSRNTSTRIEPLDKENHTMYYQEKDANNSQLLNMGYTYDWSIDTQAAILGSQYYAYTIFQLPAGIVVQYYGGKRVIGLSFLVSSVSTLVTPVISTLGAVPLIVLRVVHGLMEAPIVSAATALISHWVLPQQRCTILAFIFAGIPVGYMLGMLVGGILAEANFLGGWPSIYYMFGASSFLVFLLWMLFVHETPYVHPRISADELKIFQSQQQKPARKFDKIPWFPILTSMSVWSMNIAAFGYGWMFYFYATELPTYMFHVLHFDIRKSGLLSSAPYFLMMIISLIVSYAADQMQNRNLLTATVLRKIMNSIAAFGPSGCALLIMYAGIKSNVIVALICIGMALMGSAASGIEVVPVDMAPTYTGVLSGLLNIFFNLPGCLVPFVTSKLISFQVKELEDWSLVFAVTAAVSFLCGIVFDIWGSAAVQTWDPSNKEEENNGTEAKQMP